RGALVGERLALPMQLAVPIAQEQRRDPAPVDLDQALLRSLARELRLGRGDLRDQAAHRALGGVDRALRRGEPGRELLELPFPALDQRLERVLFGHDACSPRASAPFSARSASSRGIQSPMSWRRNLFSSGSSRIARSVSALLPAR